MERSSDKFEDELESCADTSVADYRNKRLGDRGITCLTHALVRIESSRSITITALNLWSNEIGYAGAVALAELLRTSNVLMELNLNDNSMADSGTELIAEALKQNKGLTDLNLGENKIGVGGAHALASCLEINDTLSSLNLLKNNLGDVGERAIARALLSNGTLVSLRGVVLTKYAVHLLGLPRKFRRKSNREILMYKGGFTMLHWACLRNDRDLALALILSGEDISTRSYADRTPLQIARDNGHVRLANEIEHKYGEKKVLDNYVPMKLDSFVTAFVAYCSVFVGYVDVVTDVYAAMLYHSRREYYYFSLSVLFMATPTLIAVLLQKGWGTRVVALCQCALFREVMYSVYRDQEETAMLGTLKLLESVVEACPSSLLQVYILLLAWMQRTGTDSTADSVEGRSSGIAPTFSDKVIVFSVGVAVLSASWTLSYASRTERERGRIGDKSICTLSTTCAQLERLTDISTLQLCVCLYNFAEVTFRLLSVACLFLAVGGYGLVGLGASFCVRAHLAFTFGAFDDLPQSLASHRRQAVLGGDGEKRERESFASSVVSTATSTLSLFAVVKVFCCCMFSLVTDTVWLQIGNLFLFLQILTALEGALCFATLLLLPPRYIDNEPFRAKAFSVLYVAGMSWCVKSGLAVWRWLLTSSEEEDSQGDIDDAMEGDSSRSSDGDFDSNDVSSVLRMGQLNLEADRALGLNLSPYAEYRDVDANELIEMFDEL